METTRGLFDKVFENMEKNMLNEENGDYVSDEDGLVYCGKCHTAKQQILFKLIYDRIGVLGKIINFAISYAGVVAVYHLITSIFVQEKGFYYLRLLDNQGVNKTVNFILIGIVTFFVWRKREESL